MILLQSCVGIVFSQHRAQWVGWIIGSRLPKTIHLLKVEKNSPSQMKKTYYNLLNQQTRVLESWYAFLLDEGCFSQTYGRLCKRRPDQNDHCLSLSIERSKTFVYITCSDNVGWLRSTVATIHRIQVITSVMRMYGQKSQHRIIIYVWIRLYTYSKCLDYFVSRDWPEALTKRQSLKND